MSELNNNIFMQNDGLQPLQDIVQSIMEFNDVSLTPTLVNNLTESINSLMTPSMRDSTIAAIKNDFDRRQVNKAEVNQYYINLKNNIATLINELKPSQQKLTLLNSVFDPMISMVEEVVRTYHVYDIVLPMTLDEGAQEPTYAHETDAAADLYAADTIVLPAHSISNMVRTGVHIQLPEGWIAMIFPRSSIGSKTGLRLSNSAGIIDQEYLGPLGVLYDNISDSDYTINKGDRIAQLMVMPSYHFKAKIVDKLTPTTRGEGGFGSSGK